MDIFVSTFVSCDMNVYLKHTGIEFKFYSEPCYRFLVFVLLWIGVHCRVVHVMCCPLTFTSQELLGQSLPNLVCSICRVRRQEIVSFMTPPSQGEVILG